MKLSENDREILAHSSLQRDISIAKLAAQTGLREHVVRRSLDRMTDAGVITPVIQINPYVLGLTEYYVFFALLNDRAAFEKASKILRNCENVTWLAEIGSTYRLAATILARSASQLVTILQRVSETLGALLREKHVSVCYSFHTTTAGIFSTSKVAVPFVHYDDSEKTHLIDIVDHKILRELSRRPEITLRELSTKVQAPISTVEYRLRTLKSKRLIVGQQYLVDYRKADMSEFHLALHLAQNTEQTQKKILKFGRSCPFVNYVAFLVGRWDAEIGLVVGHPEEASAILSELYELLGTEVARIDFYPTVKYLKLEYYPFDRFELLKSVD